MLLTFSATPISYRSHSCYMPCPSHTPSLDHSNYTWRRVQVMKLLIMQFSPTSCHFSSLRAKYFTQHHVHSRTLSLCSSFNVREQVSHPYKTKGKIIVLYSLIFMFLDSRREDKGFWTEWYQVLPKFSLFLISSWIKFWFVTVVPKYLNCATFSKHLFATCMSWFCPASWWRESDMYLDFSAFTSRPTFSSSNLLGLPRLYCISKKRIFPSFQKSF
jgi:hypothetical protein